MHVSTVLLPPVFMGLLYLLNRVKQFVRVHKCLKKLPVFENAVKKLRKVSGPSETFRLLVAMSNICVQENGDKLALIWFGPKASIIFLHPQACEVFFKTGKHSMKSSNYNAFRPWIKDGLVVSTGKKWSQRRKLISPSFHSDLLRSFLDVMNEQANIFIFKTEEDITRDEHSDIAKRLKLCTLDVICETAMGCQINAQENENHPYVTLTQRLTGMMAKRRRNPFLRSELIFNFTKLAREQSKILKEVHAFTRSVIDQKMAVKNQLVDDKSTNERKVFLDVLLDAQNEDGSSLSADDLQEEVDTFMFAGHDTSSSALSWAIYLLGRYPDVQKKLHEELDSVFGGDKTCDVTFEHIKDLTYLDLVIKETLRLYPPGSFIGRQTEEDFEVDGKVIPKGQDVSMFIYFIHRHPDIWKEPNKFIPERFETENRLKANRSPYAYIPFSAGPRNCVGQRFAIQEQKVILAKFFRNFTVVSHDEEDKLNLATGLVLEMADVLNVTISKRIS